MMALTHISSLILLVFSTRILPRLYLPQAFSTDTYYQMLCARSIRENHFKVPNSIKGLCFPSPFDYPPLFPFILAFFSEKAREKVERYVSASIDTILIVLAYFFSKGLFLVLFPLSFKAAALLAFSVSILYGLSPALLFFGYGPRAYQATPRTLSELLFFILAISEFNYLFNGSAAFFLLSIAMGALLLLSSKFGAQALLFFSLVMAIFVHSLLFLLVPLLGLIVAVVVTRGRYIDILKGQIGHLTLFKKITSKVYPFIQKKNRLGDLISLPKDIVCNQNRAFGTIFFNNSFIIAATRNFHLLLLGIWLFAIRKEPFLAVDQRISFMLFWIASSLIAFVITSLRPFLFLGEPERYITYSLFPQYLFLGFFIYQSKLSVQTYSCLLVYSLVLYAGYVYLFIKWHAVDKEASIAKREVFNFLKTYPQKLKILPITEDTYELAYRSGQDVLYPPGNYRIDHISTEEFKRLYEVFDSPNSDIGYIVDKYGLNAIFVSERQISYLKRNFNIEYDFNKYRSVFHNHKYRVYRVE